MTPFILDDNGKAELKRIFDYGQKHPLREGAISAIFSGRAKPPGDDAKRSCHLPVNFRVVYTLEEHQNSTWCHHLSISILNTPGRTPNLPMVEMVMANMGFKGGIHSQYSVWLEDIDENFMAVNVLGPAEAPK